jgi:hypothetical protein
MAYEEQNDRMELKERSLCNRTERYVLLQPTLICPICHQARNAQTGRDRQAFEM